MSREPIIHKIDLVDAVAQPQPQHIATRGPRRLVKLVPVMGGAPVIWCNPVPIEEVNEEGKKIAVFQCVILVEKQPKPQTMLVTIPTDLYQRLHDVPVEW